MTITGFNAAIAAQHGYSIVTLKSGVTISIKTSALRQLGKAPSDAALLSQASGSTAAAHTTEALTPSLVTPDNVVSGDCGDSWYYLYNQGYPIWKVLTGYTVYLPVSDVIYWEVDLYNPHGDRVETNSWAGIATPPTKQFTDGPPPNINVHGTWSGLVTQGEVILTNGAYCTSGHPADHQAF